MPAPNIHDNPTYAVEVVPYNSKHKGVLSVAPFPPAVEATLGKTIKIPVSDLIPYLAFHDRRKRAGWDGRQVLSKKGKQLWEYFGDDLEVTADSVRTKAVGNDAVHGFAECIGQAVGLCVLDQIYQFTEADWAPLPIESLMNLDFWIAARDGQIVELESKGSAVEDNRKQTPTISKHRDSIEKKKLTQRQKDILGKQPPVRYGAIGVIDSRPDSVLRCWLLDPPPQGPVFDPARVQIVRRMGFVLDLLTTLAPRSPITVALANRLDAVWNSADWSSLSGVALNGWGGSPIQLKKSLFFPDRLAWFDSRAAIDEMDAGGMVLPIGDGRFFFIGFVGQLLRLAVQQDFDGLNQFKASPFLSAGSITVSAKMTEALDLGTHEISHFSGRLAGSSAGRIIGVLQRDR